MANILTAQNLIDTIDSKCRKNLSRHNNKGFSYSKDVSEESVVYEISPKWTLPPSMVIVDTSTNMVMISLSLPMVKQTIMKKVSDCSILVSSSYIEFYRSSDDFIHLDFHEAVKEQEKVLAVKSDKKRKKVEPKKEKVTAVKKETSVPAEKTKKPVSRKTNKRSLI